MSEWQHKNYAFMPPEQLKQEIQKLRNQYNDIVINIDFSEQAYDKYEDLGVNFTDNAITSFGITFKFNGINSGYADDLTDDSINILYLIKDE